MKPRPALIALLLALWTPLAGASGEAPADPWSAVVRHDMNQAADALVLQLRDNPGHAPTQVALAASLLACQPRTAANIAQARMLAGEALGDASAGGDTRATALFVLGRISHVHLNRPNRTEAREHYQRLLAEHPSHTLAGIAAVHLGVLLLEPDSGVTDEEAIARIDRLAREVASDASRAELLVLGARVRWKRNGDISGALERYRKARVIGFTTPSRNGEIDLTIAGLARELGQRELAARHFEAFAEAYPRDPRAHSARRLAAEARSEEGRRAP